MTKKQKNRRKIFLSAFTAAILLVINSQARAAETEIISPENESPLEANSSELSAESLETIASPTEDNLTTPEIKEDEIFSESFSQITNVEQLRDVSPRDWAYEALRNLVERYGCIEGYPDGTYRGNTPITRYEFAAALSSCLEYFEDGSFIEDEGDLATLQRLLEEFDLELTTIDTRVDDLETRLSTLEDKQFSTTTKLSGTVFLNLTGAFADGDIRAEGRNAFLVQRDPVGRNVDRNITNDPNITLSNYLWLTLNTSFSGRDSLVVQLVAGNGNSPANQFVSAGLFNTFGVPFTDQKGVTGDDNNVVVREAFYQFPVTDKIQAVVGARINWYRYFDGNPYTFFLRGASSYNSGGSTLLNAIDRGSGAVVLWNINEQFSLRAGYLGENTEFLTSAVFNSSSNPEKGLFNATNTATVELDFKPSSNATLRFIYNRSNIDAVNGSVGGAIGEPIYGFVDDGFGGNIEDASADTFAFNFDWRITPRFGIFGRYTYGNTEIDPLTPGRAGGEVNAQAFQFGLAFPDLGKQGSLGTLSFVIPNDVLDGEEFFISGAGDGGTQYEIEATYFYPLNRNIALVPAFYFVGNPNNFGDNANIYVGNLRMQFSF